MISSRDGRRGVPFGSGGTAKSSDSANTTIVSWRPRAPHGIPRIVQREARDGRYRFFPDGRREFADRSGALEVRYPDGTETYVFSNGTKQTTYRDGRQRMEWADGASQTRTPGANLTVERRPD